MHNRISKYIDPPQGNSLIFLSPIPQEKIRLWGKFSDVRNNTIYELKRVTGAQTHSFDYDNVGNREVADGVTYTPNNLNQYTHVGATAYSYDPNGNLASDGTNTYTYDEENRLSSASGAVSSVYAYDSFNRRVSKTVSGVTTYFIYDGDHVIEERSASGLLERDYVLGDYIDEVLTMERGGNTYYYHYDGLGSVTEITDNTGAIVESYEYDAYGTPSLFDANHQPLAASAMGNPYLFTGRRWDAESGLYYYRARMYDPTIGRFLQRDPIGYYDSMNLFQYTENNPINRTDPLGLWWKPGIDPTVGLPHWWEELNNLHDTKRTYEGYLKKLREEMAVANIPFNLKELLIIEMELENRLKKIIERIKELEGFIQDAEKLLPPELRPPSNKNFCPYGT